MGDWMKECPIKAIEVILGHTTQGHWRMPRAPGWAPLLQASIQFNGRPNCRSTKAFCLIAFLQNHSSIAYKNSQACISKIWWFIIFFFFVCVGVGSGELWWFKESKFPVTLPKTWYRYTLCSGIKRINKIPKKINSANGTYHTRHLPSQGDQIHWEAILWPVT